MTKADDKKIKVDNKKRKIGNELSEENNEAKVDSESLAEVELMRCSHKLSAGKYEVIVDHQLVKTKTVGIRDMIERPYIFKMNDDEDDEKFAKTQEMMRE